MMPDDKVLTPKQVKAVVKQTPWHSEEILAKSHEALRLQLEQTLARETALLASLDISLDDVGGIMHESWTKTKRAQGFHDPDGCTETGIRQPCRLCHVDLIPWEQLPEQQKDINRHAFDAVLAEMRKRAGVDVAKTKEAAP